MPTAKNRGDGQRFSNWARHWITFQPISILCNVGNISFCYPQNAFGDALVRFSPNTKLLPCNVPSSSDNLRAASPLRAQSPVGQNVDALQPPVEAAGHLKRVEHRAQLLQFRYLSAVLLAPMPAPA